MSYAERHGVQDDCSTQSTVAPVEGHAAIGMAHEDTSTPPRVIEYSTHPAESLASTHASTSTSSNNENYEHTEL